MSNFMICIAHDVLPSYYGLVFTLLFIMSFILLCFCAKDLGLLTLSWYSEFRNCLFCQESFRMHDFNGMLHVGIVHS